MTDQVPIENIGDYSSKKLDMLMRAVVLEADKLVKEGSPVLTGRFAASWQIGENSVDGPVAKEGDYGSEGVGTVIRPPQGVNTNKITAANTYHIHNNLPYAERLCYQGWSKKVDANWFEMVGKEMQDISKQWWNDIAKGDVK